MKGRLRPMLGFKTFYNARRVIIGIELARKIHKRQFNADPMAVESRGDLASRHGSIGCIALLVLSRRQSHLHQNPPRRV